MAGYYRYSMSNNARQAYADGEKPISKWTKSEILDAIEDVEKARAFKKVKAAILKAELLTNSSWHHTSNRFNKTDFYSIDFDKIESLTIAEIEAMQEQEQKKVEVKTMFGDFHYLEWSGTRKHPKAAEIVLNDVEVIEKGAFYIVLNPDGSEKLRKKIFSNGTKFRRKVR